MNKLYVCLRKLDRYSTNQHTFTRSNEASVADNNCRAMLTTAKLESYTLTLAAATAAPTTYLHL